MKILSALVLCAAAAFAAAPVTADAPASPVPLDPSSNVLFKRMVALNSALRTYRATIHLDVALKSFPFVSPSLDGTAYYKRPDKEAVVFDTVPALASQFKKVYPKVEPPAEWHALYDAYVMTDSGGSTVFRLVPKKNGRVDHLDVKVDDANATIVGYTWTYKDGGFVSFDQTFKSVDGNFLVDKQNGHVELPSYKADVTSQFSNYKLNVAIADSVFEQN
jgi:outer membrane lipoprotein-sorting protein